MHCKASNTLILMTFSEITLADSEITDLNPPIDFNGKVITEVGVPT